jgi:hypothetical protein
MGTDDIFPPPRAVNQPQGNVAGVVYSVFATQPEPSVREYVGLGIALEEIGR